MGREEGNGGRKGERIPLMSFYYVPGIPRGGSRRKLGERGFFGKDRAAVSLFFFFFFSSPNMQESLLVLGMG